ncbi:hypothetical protein TVAG_475780 [Trichomonas vaginalis G3]|uniref:Uncharacterized protein n=1 Tax=Trichomonas vaginalis (strain ATCC PRA-98 / G3) TaxID=412133 RepID=A2DA02_TRIV3|nr:Dcp1-like decapping family [Trichomonas vaginalis G3]EAY22650.1 hypothetical protein TVAG_475780 [Trichomonas vaginalis G3]KAI5525464.1 Dcp1-like decapping family [Trichomonas vaginalis G3]|eukprot:XP_001583636.1 hypothetical protein [Trichomonas vaginalis G3]
MQENLELHLNFDQQYRKDTNLRVIRKIFQEVGYIQDYLNVYPEVCIYKKSEDGRWVKLQIGGPLFLCVVQNQTDLTLFLLNNTQTNEESSFYKKLNPQTRYAIQGNQLYIKTDQESDMVYSFHDERDVQDLISKLRDHYSQIVTNDENELRVLQDPTLQRLAKRVQQ